MPNAERADMLFCPLVTVYGLKCNSRAPDRRDLKCTPGHGFTVHVPASVREKEKWLSTDGMHLACIVYGLLCV